jgi:polyhydroxyalkanoate synthase
METSARVTGTPQSLPPALSLFSEQQRLWRRLLSVPRVLEVACRPRAVTTPHEVVLRDHTHELVHYVRDTPATHPEPVLLCYALVNRPYILDLQPDKSVVRRYLEQGFDVYMIDWGVPSPGDRGLTLDSYVGGFLSKAADLIRSRHNRADLHLMGYCMGGTMGALYTALNPDRVKTLTLLAAPIDFGRRDSLLNMWTDSRYFDVDALVDTYGNCPAWFLQLCFLSLDPVRNFVDKPISFYEHMDDPRIVSSHFALEHWLNDNIPVAGETFREFVKKLYQGNQLVRGQLTLGDRRVDLGRITCPLLIMTATNDHLVPPSSSEGIRPHIGSRDVHSMQSTAGHVGLVVGGRAHKQLWPQAMRWLVERSGSMPGHAPAPALDQPASQHAVQRSLQQSLQPSLAEGGHSP